MDTIQHAPADFSRSTSLTPDLVAEIDNAFSYHAWTPEQVEAADKIRTALADAFKAIITAAPPSDDRSSALHFIRLARAEANSAIAHGGKY